MSEIYSPRQLTKQLADAGVTITPAERKTWLKLSIGTIKRKINALKKAAADAGVTIRGTEKNTHKVGDVLDGLSTYHSYPLIAVAGENAAVSAKQWSPGGSIKVKFYPNAAAFGFKQVDMVEFGATGFQNRGQHGGDYYHRTYQRMFISPQNFEKLVAKLQAIKGTKTLSLYNAIQVYQGGEVDPKQETLAKKVSTRPSKPKKTRVKKVVAAVKSAGKKAAQVYNKRPTKPVYDPGNDD